MVAKLSNDNVLSIIQGSTINAYNSLKNNMEFYISEKVKTINPSECNVLFIFVDKNKLVYSTNLQKIESDKDDYFKYQISDGNDFCVPSGFYTGYILIYDPTEKTHISSTTVRFVAIDGTDADLNLAVTANAIDEVIMELNKMKAQMNVYLEKIKSLTELNIKISNEIKEKGDN